MGGFESSGHPLSLKASSRVEAESAGESRRNDPGRVESVWRGSGARPSVARMVKSALTFAVFSLVVLAGFGSAAHGAAKTNTPISQSETRPFLGWELDFETGILWRAGHNGSPLNYIILPQILTLKNPPVARRPLGKGELTLRSRFSFMVEPIVKGPEKHFTAATVAGLIEWWNAAQTFSFFFSSGGGLGGLDSRGYDVVGAQGQDLNFTWFVYPGMRVRASENFHASLGLYYQHLSNRDLDKINPGIDAVGPMVSVSWRF